VGVLPDSINVDRDRNVLARFGVTLKH